MPTIDIEFSEFEKLLGMKFQKNMAKVDDILAFVKGEVKAFDEKNDSMNIEIKDTNRPDLWNIEGLTRTLRGFLGIEMGLQKYSLGEKLIDVYVDDRLQDIRPYIGCSVVKNLKLTDTIIRGLMHLQDKLDQTYGRNRQRTSIGLYNFDMIKTPLHYAVAKPTEVSFVPLGFNEKMNLEEMLTCHPKGLEYGHILSKHPVYPILLDGANKPLSFPPIINSNDLGKITEETKNVLVEVTGTTHETVLNTLKIVTLSLIDRGGEAHSANVHYQDEKNVVVTPNFSTNKMELDIFYADRTLGVKLTAKKTMELLSRAGYDAEEAEGDKLNIKIPCYRIDVMHPIDIVEDIAIAYDYNNIKPIWRKIPTTGALKPEHRLMDTARELMVGLGFQEVFTYTLTNPENLFTRMNVKRDKIIEISNPKVTTLTCLRSWLLPSLMELVSNNLHVETPQKIFELGIVTLIDETKETKTRDENRLAAIIYGADASFTASKSTLDAFFMNFGLEWKMKETTDSTFIDGRAAEVMLNGNNVGKFGEVHPKVLEAWRLENPVAALELNVTSIVCNKLAQL